MKLTLTKHTLTELSTDELGQIVGGQPPTLDGCLTGVYPTLPVQQCLGDITK